MFAKPSKRLRRDSSERYGEDNDDFGEWGVDDITAEECDFLEYQATQQQQRDEDKLCTFPPPSTSNNSSSHKTTLMDEENKQIQYEMEGKVKLLKQHVETLTRKLREEKLTRNKILNQKADEFREKESAMQREIKKFESILQFKEQEMKSLYDKINSVKNESKAKYESPKPPERERSNEFVKRFKFDSGTPTSPKVDKSSSIARRYKLQVDCPRGQSWGSDFVSLMLCNKLVISAEQNPYFTPLSPGSSDAPSFNNRSQLSAVSIAKLNSKPECEELLDHFSFSIKNYLLRLKSYSSRCNAGSSSTNSPCLLKRDMKLEQDRLISTLKDLTYFVSSHHFVISSEKINSSNVENNQMIVEESSPHEASTSRLIVNSVHHLVAKLQSLVNSLVCLLNPKTYPSGYSKSDEVQWSLSVLVSWSSAAPHSLKLFANELPYTHLLKSLQSAVLLKMILRLITNLCVYKELIPLFTHQNDFCLLCKIAIITHRKILSSPNEFVHVMISVEDFVSTLISMYSFTEFRFDITPCLTVSFQAITTALLKYFLIYKEENYNILLILKKGFTLLHLLSRYIPSFKERRSGCEDVYISLVCGMLSLSKEKIEFKEFYDLAHDLWDFQEDTSEFDLEDATEDSSQQVMS